jgi:hypothetical protein
MVRLERFTQEQWIVLDSLVSAHSIAARELGRVSHTLLGSALRGDSETFRVTRSALEAARAKYEATQLAIHTAREAFLEENARATRGLCALPDWASIISVALGNTKQKRARGTAVGEKSRAGGVQRRSFADRA